MKYDIIIFFNYSYNRSPDLTPVDFFVWGYLKNIASTNESRNPEEIVGRLHAVLIDMDAAMLRRTSQNIITRAAVCIEANGILNTCCINLYINRLFLGPYTIKRLNALACILHTYDLILKFV